jgi:hypothetical protein
VIVVVVMRFVVSSVDGGGFRAKSFCSGVEVRSAACEWPNTSPETPGTARAVPARCLH